LALAERSAKAKRGREQLAAWSAALYRSGRGEESAGRLREAVPPARGGPTACESAWLALALKALGRDGEAREGLQRAEGTARGGKPAWQEQAEWCVLKREAQPPAAEKP